MKGSQVSSNLNASHSKALEQLRANASGYPAGDGTKSVKSASGKVFKLNPPSKGHAPKGAHGRAAVRALGRTKTTGNFKKIEQAKGKGAAIAAYQNALRAHKG